MFSLGSNGVTGFESDVRKQYPHCAIHVYDPTIDEHTAAVVAGRTNVRLRPCCHDVAHQLSYVSLIESVRPDSACR